MGSAPGPNLATVLVPRHIAAPVHPVLDGPVTANEAEQVGFGHWVRRQPREAVGHLLGGAARRPVRHAAGDAPGLLDKGKPSARVIERVRDRHVPSVRVSIRPCAWSRVVVEGGIVPRQGGERGVERGRILVHGEHV